MNEDYASDDSDIRDNNSKADNKKKKNDDEKREKPMTICFCRYDMIQDSFNYYREQVMLYLPWRCGEKDIIKQDCEILYNENIDIIKENRNKYCKINEDLLQDAVKDVYDGVYNINIEELNDFNKSKLNVDEEVDIFEQDEKEVVKDTVCNRCAVSIKVSEEEYYKVMET